MKKSQFIFEMARLRLRVEYIQDVIALIGDTCEFDEWEKMKCVLAFQNIIASITKLPEYFHKNKLTKKDIEIVDAQITGLLQKLGFEDEREFTQEELDFIEKRQKEINEELERELNNETRKGNYQA